MSRQEYLAQFRHHSDCIHLERLSKLSGDRTPRRTTSARLSFVSSRCAGVDWYSNTLSCRQLRITCVKRLLRSLMVSSRRAAGVHPLCSKTTSGSRHARPESRVHSRTESLDARERSPNADELALRVEVAVAMVVRVDELNPLVGAHLGLHFVLQASGKEWTLTQTEGFHRI